MKQKHDKQNNHYYETTSYQERDKHRTINTQANQSKERRNGCRESTK